MPAASKAPKIKVFISYSRQNLELVDRLRVALEARGIDAFVDRTDIEKGEDFWKRIKQLIIEADTIVFVLSPSCLASEWCMRELEFAESLSKRFLPIVAQDVSGLNVPNTLAILNYIFFIPNIVEGATGDFTEGVDSLETALRKDIDWTREHTRIGLLAQRWMRRQRSPDSLIRGSELRVALDWATRRPHEAPLVSIMHRQFLNASLAAAIAPLEFLAVLGFFTLIPGFFSTASLLKMGLELKDFYPPFQWMLDSYHAVLHTAFGWMEPTIHDFHAFVKSWTSWRLELTQSWKHIAFLMLLFFKSFARVLGGDTLISKSLAWVVGGVISVAIGIGLGSTTANAAPGELISLAMNLIVLITPLAIIALVFIGSGIRYCFVLAKDHGTTWLEEFRKRPLLRFLIAGAGLGLLLIAIWLSGLVRDPASDLLLARSLLQLPRSLIVAISIALAIAAFFAWAALAAIAYSRENYTSWWEEFRHNQWTTIGSSMLIVIVGGVAFVALNAIFLTQMKVP